MPAGQHRPTRLRRVRLVRVGPTRAEADRSTRTKAVCALALCVNAATIAALLWALASREPPPEDYREKVLDPASDSGSGRSGGTDGRGRQGAHKSPPGRRRQPATEPFSGSEDEREPPRPLDDNPQSTVHRDHDKVDNYDSKIRSTLINTEAEGEATTVAEVSTAGTTEAATSETATSTTTSTNTISSTAVTTSTTSSTSTASTTKTTFLVTNSTPSTTSSTTTTTEEVLNFEVDISPSYSVVCYFNHTSYRREEPMSFRTGHIPAPYCSHIIYASVGVDDEYELVAKDPAFDIERSGFAKFASLKKRYRHVSVMVAIGDDIGDSNAFQRMSTQKQDVVAFARNVASWLQQYRYDGVVIQWKMPVNRRNDSGAKASRYRQKLRGVAAALRDSLGANSELFVAVPNNEELRRTYFNFDELSRHVDRFLVVGNWVLRPEDGSREESSSTVKFTAFADPLNDVLQTRHALVGAGNVQLFRKFCFVLSVGARTYTLLSSGKHNAHAAASGPGKPGPYTRQPGLLAYYEVCSQTWPTAVQGTFASYVARDDQWVGYLDASNVQRLLRMALYKHRAACLGVWDVSLDDFRGVCGDAFPFTKVVSGWHDQEWKGRRREFGSHPNKH
ncbi:chitinase-3-like protein 1 isoform X1 [Amblyomma americanum]